MTAPTRERTMRKVRWPETMTEAKAIQSALRNEVCIGPLKKKPHFIAGVDASFVRSKVIGIACLYSYPELIYLDHTVAVMDATFPYVPGYLTFREGPAIVEALFHLKTKPDLMLVDGQGIAHPRGIGIASHIGVLLGIPSVGCAKSRLIGEYEEPGTQRGEWAPLKYEGRVVGAVLRTRDDVRPLFVSPGHGIDLKSSIRIVLGCTSRYRISEPLRMADILSKKVRKELLAGQM